jgi:hypothetical protein
LLMSSESGAHLMITSEEHERERGAIRIQRAYRASNMYPTMLTRSNNRSNQWKTDDGNRIEMAEEEDPDLTSMDMDRMSPMSDRRTSDGRLSQDSDSVVESNSRNKNVDHDAPKPHPLTYDMGVFSKELRRIQSRESVINGSPQYPQYDAFDDAFHTAFEEELWDTNRPSTALPSITVTRRQTALSDRMEKQETMFVEQYPQEDEDREDPTNMRMAGRTATQRPYTAYDDTRHQKLENVRAAKHESKRISELREQRFMKAIAE